MIELIIDSFAGGGGASTGIEIALGRSPDIAINHDAVALAMHEVNHPATKHLTSDIWDVDPVEACQGRPVGLLWASPDCKHFSKAKGGKPVEKKIRGLAWVVVHWANVVAPRVIILENVEEFSSWGPLATDGRPCPLQKGVTFKRWLSELERLGYAVEWRELRACHYGAPTLRKRLFLIARRDGEPISWPQPTHKLVKAYRDGRAGVEKVEPPHVAELKPARVAAEIIDWSLPCPSIFDSAGQIMAKYGLRAVRPLQAATMARLAKGTRRYVVDAARPFLVNLTHQGAARAATPATILRNAAGEPPLGSGGLAFRDDQGEMFWPHDQAYRTPATRIGVLKLESGQWLALPPGFHVDDSRFDNRDAALRTAISRVIRKARRYVRNRGDGEGTSWSDGYAGRVIEWALSLKPEAPLGASAAGTHPESDTVEDACTDTPASASPHPFLLRPESKGERENDRMWGNSPGAGVVIDNEEITAATNPDNGLGVKTTLEEISDASAVASAKEDPVVAELVAAHRLRKTFPAGHTFSMTNPIQNGRMVTLGTCTCGHAFCYAWGGHELMDAAIEAHWQKFDHLPEKVDGRGLPINAEDGAVGSKQGRHSPAPKRTRRSAPKTGDTPELANAALPEPASVTPRVEGAGSSLSEPGTGGPPVPNIADGPHHRLRSEPAPETSPDGAGSLIDDDARRRAALEMIGRRGFALDPEIVRDLVGIGYVKPTLTRLVVTEQGEAFLKQAAPTGAGSENSSETASDILVGFAGDCSGIKCGENRNHGQAGRAAELNADLETGVTAGETDSDTCERAAAESGATAGETAPDSNPDPAARDGCKGEPNSASGRLRALDVGTLGRGSDQAFTVPAATPLPDPPPQGGREQEADVSGEVLAETDDLAIEWPCYDAFLEDKIVTAPLLGIEVARESLHPWLKPHCKDLTLWALRLGCAAIFANFGLHKTAMQLEWCRQLHRHAGGATLNVVPLGVRHGFIKEALQLGMEVRFIRTDAEFAALSAEGVVHFLTNYESIREGKLDPNRFAACSLDEASVLRSYGSKTFQEFLPLFSKVEFKLVATATPSPNRYKELIHYAGFLGVMDTGLALTRWFQRNSEKAGDLTLYPHKQDEFWMWVHSWAAFLQRPSELGYSDDGYELPPLQLRWHEVPADHSKAQPERDGQGVMFRNVASSLQDAAKSRRDSLGPRIAKMVEIIAQDPDSHRVIWHDLEAEREAIEAALPGVVSIMGSMDIDAREERLRAFEEGETKWFATKPILSGSGSNFQYHCHKAIYVALPGYGYKFNDFLQSLYRLQRFGQAQLVEVDIIYSEDERAGRAALEEKWARDIEMRTRMSEIITAHGLNTLPLRDALLRTLGVKRVEIRGKNFVAINNDCVAECRAWPDNSVDQIVSSIPFAYHYEYSASYRDFGHTDDNGHFWGQMDFLTSELLRMLKPGRLACIHVKDRVLFGAVTGEGVPTISPFHAEAIMHYRAHGFQYMGMITVVTDVVRENNQTYRLGYSENCKDGSKIGVGSPEYVLLLRKRQSDRSRSYADVPVVKTKAKVKAAAPALSPEPEPRCTVEQVEHCHNQCGEHPGWCDSCPFRAPGEKRTADKWQDGYSLARWQIDAHALWKSSGNRLLTPEEFASFSSADLAKLFAKTSAQRVYDYEAHVKIGEALERSGTLPSTFMAIAPGSQHPEVWTDINRMRTLNMLQQRKGAEKHLCPLQFDIVDRLIERFSNEGDLIFDPFGGLMTVPYRALLKKRRGAAVELSASYFLDGVHYCRMAEEKMETPQLFDLATFDAANTPPPSDLMESEA